MQWLGLGEPAKFPIEDGGVNQVEEYDEDVRRWHEYEEDTVSLRFRVHMAIIESLMRDEGHSKLAVLCRMLSFGLDKEVGGNMPAVVNDIIALFLQLLLRVSKKSVETSPEEESLAGTEEQIERMLTATALKVDQELLLAAPYAFEVTSATSDHRSLVECFIEVATKSSSARCTQSALLALSILFDYRSDTVSSERLLAMSQSTANR